MGAGGAGEKSDKVLTCIRCPRGCRITVALGAGGEVEALSGNACPRGDAYARAEVAAPVRMVTTTVPVDRARDVARVAVKTAREVPKDAVLDVVARDVAGTGVNVIATSRAC